MFDTTVFNKSYSTNYLADIHRESLTEVSLGCRQDIYNNSHKDINNLFVYLYSEIVMNLFSEWFLYV